MGFTPVKSSAGKAMNPPPPATEFSSPPSMAAKNRRIAWESVTYQCTCSAARLNGLQVGDGAFVLQVAGIEGGLGFEQHHVDFLVGTREVLDAVRDDDELAFADGLLTLSAVFPDSHAQRALEHQEHLVFVVVMVPHELALHLGEFDMKIVDLANDLGA